MLKKPVTSIAVVVSVAVVDTAADVAYTVVIVLATALGNFVPIAVTVALALAKKFYRCCCSCSLYMAKILFTYRAIQFSAK